MTSRKSFAAPSLPVLSAPPSSPDVGTMYFDSNYNNIFVWDGSVWQYVLEIITYVFQQQGTLAVKTGTQRLYIEGHQKFVGGYVGVSTGPTGSAILLDINKNGTTIYTTQTNRPTIITSSTSGGLIAPDVDTFTQGDYITVDIDQVGSTVAGADMVLTLRFSKYR